MIWAKFSNLHSAQLEIVGGPKLAPVKKALNPSEDSKPGKRKPVENLKE